ncbi:MAG: TetR/AcrR family transcriptional regulator [Pseudomonadales bacterium]|nr:TetR/AcrR family transcriptional regulator [Pseudomonadales bacterium]
MSNTATAEKSKKAPKLRSDSTIEKIIDAAEALFAEKSYEATTLREIARAVGIKEPSIYAHFSNKEAIYNAVIDRALIPFFNEVYAWNRADLTLKEMNEIPRKLMQLHSAHPNSARILHKELCNPSERINQKVLDWNGQIIEESRQFMESLPENERKHINLAKVVANSIGMTNIMLGVFSTQAIQIKLLGDDYDEEVLFEEHIKLITKLFKSLLV